MGSLFADEYPQVTYDDGDVKEIKIAEIVHGEHIISLYRTEKRGMVNYAFTVFAGTQKQVILGDSGEIWV